MTTTESRVIRIGFEWQIVEKATGRIANAGTSRTCGSSASHTHDSLVASAKASLANGRKYQTRMVRHWVEC